MPLPKTPSIDSLRFISPYTMTIPLSEAPQWLLDQLEKLPKATPERVGTDLAPNPSEKEHIPVSNNARTYEITLADGSEPVIIHAESVHNEDGRLRFQGQVEGYEGLGSRETVASYLSDQVVSYRLVPNREDVRVGAQTYAVHLTGGEVLEVQADKVLYVKGNDASPGVYTLTTVLSGYDQFRTELSIAETKVDYVKNVNSGATVPGQADGSEGPQDAALKTS